MNEAVADFPFVATLPKREKSRLARLWDHFAAVREISKEHGMLVPVKMAADLAGVSHQRIADLIGDGRLVRIDLHGHRYVTENSFVEWAKSERKNGRPLKVQSSNESVWNASLRAAKGIVENTSK